MTTLNKTNIVLIAWLSNNEQWRDSINKDLLDIDQWEHYEIIHFYNYGNFLVYCWNGTAKAEGGRLFKARHSNYETTGQPIN